MSESRTTEVSGEKLPPDQREVCHFSWESVSTGPPVHSAED